MAHRCLSPEQFAARRIQLQQEEAQQPERWHWCSFADESGNLGVAVVRARGPLDSITRCNTLKINPGGEVMFFELPLDKDTPQQIHDELIKKADRLLDKQEAIAFDAHCKDLYAQIDATRKFRR